MGDQGKRDGGGGSEEGEIGAGEPDNAFKGAESEHAEAEPSPDHRRRRGVALGLGLVVESG